MSLSCSCAYDDYEEWWKVTEEFVPLKTKRSRRCCSCKSKIKPGDECLVFERGRYPKTEVEARIYGGDDGEVPLAPWHLCSECGEQYLNLKALGYECLDITNIKGEIEEYWDMTGFDPKKYAAARAQTIANRGM